MRKNKDGPLYSTKANLFGMFFNYPYYSILCASRYADDHQQPHLDWIVREEWYRLLPMLVAKRAPKMFGQIPMSNEYSNTQSPRVTTATAVASTAISTPFFRWIGGAILDPSMSP